MKTYSLIFLISLFIPIFAATHTTALAFPQDQTADTTEVIAEDEEDLLASSNMWDLVGQAGPIRYPIFSILAIGLFLIGLKAIDIFSDKKRANVLMNTPFPDLNLGQMTRTLERQPENMLSIVMAKLLNVFQTNKNADYLHDEISNYSQLQQNNFNSFRNRVDFLSDTAGALGLLGTVWGMFMVFSSGNLEKESILAGMGLALMSTLLGLIVSIILNFSSTLTEGFFSKRLERVTDKADEMRFRLIELSDNPNSTEAPPTRTTVGSSVVTAKSSNNKPSDVIRDKISQNNVNIPKPDSPIIPEINQIEEEKKVEPKNIPNKLKLKTEQDKTRLAADKVKDIKVQLIGSDGDPIENEKIEIVLMRSGKINGKKDRDVMKTDKNGEVSFDWQLSEKAGTQKAGVRVAKKGYQHIKKELSFEVAAAKPDSLQILNNHQAVETGKPVHKPIVAVVKDAFDNPVSEVNVSMNVSMGNGAFENGRDTFKAKTDANGRVETGFTLGDEPGFNAVDIKLDEFDLNKNFQAVGQEVTA